MECSLSEFEEEGCVDWCVGGLVLRKDKTRQDKTRLKTRKDLLLFVPQHFFWPKKSTTHKQKSALSWGIWSRRCEVKKSNFSNQISQALSLSLIKERRRFHSLPSTYTTFWMDGSLTFHKQTFFPSQNLLQICFLSLSLSLSLSHTHTHKIHILFHKIPTPNSTGNHNLDEEEGIEP